MRMELGFGRWQFFHRSVEHAHAREPIIDVLSTVTSRDAPPAANREENFLATLVEFFGYLHTRLTASHNKYRSFSQRRWFPILHGMKLQNVSRNGFRNLRKLWRLVKARGDHNISGLIIALACPNPIGSPVRFHAKHFNAATDRQAEMLHVVIEVF